MNFKKLRITIISSTLLFPSLSMAEILAGFSILSTAKGKSISGYKFEDPKVFKFYFFKLNRSGGKWGYYGSVGTTFKA